MFSEMDFGRCGKVVEKINSRQINPTYSEEEEINLVEEKFSISFVVYGFRRPQRFRLSQESVDGF